MSTDGTYQKWDALGQPLFWWDQSHYGSAISFLENQYPVEVILASRLIKRLAEYPLVVISDWDYIEPEFHQAAVDYVTSGGRLLLIGSEPAHIFGPPSKPPSNSRRERLRSRMRFIITASATG